jgi:hypothetical protein
MSIDIIPEGQTIDPLKIAYEKLVKVFKFLKDKDLEEHADEIADVLDQLGGWACDSAQLDAKYPDDKYVKKDTEWRKKMGYCHD